MLLRFSDPSAFLSEMEIGTLLYQLEKVITSYYMGQAWPWSNHLEYVLRWIIGLCSLAVGGGKRGGAGSAWMIYITPLRCQSVISKWSEILWKMERKNHSPLASPLCYKMECITHAVHCEVLTASLKQAVKWTPSIHHPCPDRPVPRVDTDKLSRLSSCLFIPASALYSQSLFYSQRQLLSVIASFCQQQEWGGEGKKRNTWKLRWHLDENLNLH